MMGMKRRRRGETEGQTELEQLSTMESLEMEFAPTIDEIAQAKTMMRKFDAFGIHSIVVNSRDYVGALESLEAQVLEYQDNMNQEVESEKRDESIRLYAELHTKTESLLAQLKVWDVQQICNDALADPRYTYHLRKIKQIAKDAQDMANVISWAKPHLATLKGKSIKIGNLLAKVDNIINNELVMQKGAGTRFRKKIEDLEPPLVYQLAQRSGNSANNRGEFHRSMGVFLYYSKNYKESMGQFESAKAKGADVMSNIDIIAKIQISVRDERERKAIAKAYKSARKYLDTKRWALLKKTCVDLRLAHNESGHFKKIEEQIIDWTDIAYDNLEGKYEMVSIPAGTYKNVFDEPVRSHAFQIDRWEVSQRQYSRFLRWIKKSGSHIYCHPDEKMYGEDKRFYGSMQAMQMAGVMPGPKDHTPLEFQEYVGGWEDFPVVNLDWYDAYAYATWRGKRLPSVAEYIRAVSGNDYRLFPWGKKWRPEYCNANDGGTSDGSLDGYRGVAPIKEFKDGKSPFGIFNLAGNVREFVNRPNQNVGGSYRDGKSMCSIRGSSRLQVRNGVPQRLPFVGFRCVKDPAMEE